MEIFHWVEGENTSIFPHTLVVCGENSKVTVIDHFKSADGKRAFACGVNDLHLERGAQLNYIAVQEWATESLAFHLNSTIVGRDASSTALNINFGGGFVRGESLSRLIGEGARSVMLSLNPMHGERQIDQRTLQDHAAPHASSDLLYLNSLDDAARTIFAGLIKVERGAHRTDAYQKVRNLMLSDQAEANSMPGLEILADDVRCTHGATPARSARTNSSTCRPAASAKPTDAALSSMDFFSLCSSDWNRSLREYLGRLVSEKLGVPRLKRVAGKLGASAAANFCLSTREDRSSDRVRLLQAFAEADRFVAEIGARFTVIEVGVLHDAGDRIPRQNRLFLKPLCKKGDQSCRSGSEW